MLRESHLGASSSFVFPFFSRCSGRTDAQQVARAELRFGDLSVVIEAM
jgi:hypothetical protein